jgi:hypothetical protein
MKRNPLKSFALMSGIWLLAACDKTTNTDPASSLDKLVVGTNITTANPVIGYVGTLKDLSVGNFTNAKSRQTQQYPYVTVYKNDVFVMPQQFGDIVTKYTRQSDGTLAETGKFTAPAASSPLGMVIESDTKGYCSLWKAGKILVFNPSTMSITRTIDVSSYGLGDGNPDPSVMELNNGKLYVACSQTTDGFTSSRPAQVLIIEVNNGDKITSVTDNRTTWASSLNEQKSLFFDELGDMYIFCVASYGFGGPTQKCGFLRIKKDQTTFDKDYFFNVADYKIDGIPGNKVDYLQRFRYTSGGIVYSTGNIYALASNPPDYIKDRTYGSFKVDVRNRTITKLDLPYSNGYSACVLPYENKILFGLATSTGVGIYSFDPATNTSVKTPLVNTQGDPSILEAFQ